jgi:Frequency clock protein
MLRSGSKPQTIMSEILRLRWLTVSQPLYNLPRKYTYNRIDDPPFLLRNSSSSEPSPEGRSENPMSTLHPHPHSSHYQSTNLVHMPTMASSSEDYRSIIDDLTVQNKKLKRKLKKYERFENPSLQSHKVVELRTFNVPANKKRELEEMLKNFTMGLEECHEDESSGNGYETQRIPATLEPRKTTSSHTSTRFGDSAYASMSASGNNSTAPSGHGTLNSWKVPKSLGPPSISQQRRQNIQAYLHDIPVGLLPNSAPTVMTEKSKRKLVVRRLEQLFAGKASNANGHQQPLQQQEVAQSAAQADRQAIEDSGCRALEEGAREARIMPKVEGEPGASKEVSSSRERLPVDSKVSRQDFGEEPSEQRPTRPLDLDPYRAQVPAENIDYIRHLGFSPLDVESTTPQGDGHGWIYLNLLMNMAQLHTTNVTADFVRKSISEFSQKLEISRDGRKVRWKGGTDVTRTSSDSSPEDDHGRSGASSYLKAEPRKKSKLSTTFSSNDGSSENIAKSTRKSSHNKLAYTPLFFHKVEPDDDMSEDGLTSWSSPPAGLAGDSSGFTSSGMRTSSSRRKPGDDGPIIFYNKANFCTDLSGDPRGKNLAFSNKLNYSRLATAPIGDFQEAWSSPGKPFEKRGPLSQSQSAAAEPIDVDSSTPNELQMEIHRPNKPATEGSSSEESPNPIELEASGIGGIIPVDNFAIRVKARRQLDDQSDSIISLRQQRSKLYPPHIRNIIAQRSGSDSSVVGSIGKGKAAIREEVISERRKELPPSELPPPSFFPFGSPDEYSEDSSSGSEAEDDLSNSAAALASHRPLPSAAPQLMNWPTFASGEESSSEEDDEDDLEDDESEGSLDLLASARKVDPMAIRAKEREYDSHMAERLAEVIPTGSSAATAGGGSGFNSPDSPVEDSAEKAVGSLRKPGLKRARTDESIAVHGRRTRKSPRLEA